MAIGPHNRFVEGERDNAISLAGHFRSPKNIRNINKTQYMNMPIHSDLEKCQKVTLTDRKKERHF